jgi:cytochrome o ubiquinol oxidase subunit 2
MLKNNIFYKLILGALFLMISACGGILEPYGEIAIKQKELILITIGLMLIVIIPVLFLIVFFAFRYRESNKKAVYQPEWSHNTALEVVWWTIPIIIITILSVITWNSSHDLDPYKPLDHDKKPITIEVLALNWKWLFIYPEQKIATINFVQVPENTPVNFKLASDAPMNSFWIPQIAGQIYTMAGMVTKLHIIVNKQGEYNGLSANYSGEGFEGMKFILKATSQQEFDAWVKKVQSAKNVLSKEAYEQLIKDTTNHPVVYYSSYYPSLFNDALMKYMGHMDHSKMDHSTMDHSKMDHSTMDHSKMDHSTMDHSKMKND